ncbi:MAG TPA: hypothetical protein VEN82_07525 [Actinomycetota bacterium]|nr:hypothetical protein [Actinomycetota bacterium]
MKAPRHAGRFAAGILLVSVLVLGAAAAPAGATVPAKTKVTLKTATVTGSSINMAGKLTVGTTALAAIQVANDPAGDCADCAAPNGTDIGTATIQANLTAGTLTFTINILNPPPNLAGPPFFVYDWQIAVDGVDNGYFLQAGNVGGFPPQAGTFFSLCQNTASGFDCTLAALQGTLASGVVQIVLPMSDVGAVPGSVISSGHSLGTAPTIASTFSPSALLFYDTGGDDAVAADYTTPGAVKLGIAPSTVPPNQVDASTPATVGPTGAYKGSLPKPAPGTYVVVAKSCNGSGAALVCAIASKIVTVT